jgi:FlaA1/EpsC-like NDP-sugar epimerase
MNNIEEFVLKITKRDTSLFYEDLIDNNTNLINSINNKNVLVIGGAGTIGSSFIKSLLKFHPKKLVVIDQDENGLVELVRDLRSSNIYNIPTDFFTYPVSYNSEIFSKIFLKHKNFNIVANFAAHKHVRSEKDIFSIEALVYNNFINTKTLLDQLTKFKPDHFFCVSTDKAASPVNIMGASKKLMEELLITYSSKFKITTARFANVAFSNGSLLYGFTNRLNKTQPISCPSDIKRFFVSQEEAGQICLLTCILGKTGEVFFPKLDPNKDLISFTNFIEPFLKIYGFTPIYFNNEQDARQNIHLIKEYKYPVYLSKSDSSGEKLYEEFFDNTDNISLNSFKSLGVIKKNASFTIDDINTLISELKNLFSNELLDKKEIVNLFDKYIGNFNHIETGISLDSKM